MARLQDRVVRVAETRGEVALDKLDRSAQVMRSLRYATVVEFEG
jgi:hypothetical protein